MDTRVCQATMAVHDLPQGRYLGDLEIPVVSRGPDTFAFIEGSFKPLTPRGVIQTKDKIYLTVYYNDLGENPAIELWEGTLPTYLKEAIDEL